MEAEISKIIQVNYKNMLCTSFIVKVITTIQFLLCTGHALFVNMVLPDICFIK
jgi:hypothetical protein